jgi:hypothetical protein
MSGNAPNMATGEIVTIRANASTRVTQDCA